MADATLKNQERILSMEKRIIQNQARLALIIGNQETILRELQAMVKNQKKILANQTRILTKSKPGGATRR